MKKAEIEQLRLVIREEIQPIRELTLSHEQTLYGAKGEKEASGLVNEVAGIRQRVFIITSGIAGAITAGFNTVIYLLRRE